MKKIWHCGLFGFYSPCNVCVPSVSLSCLSFVIFLTPGEHETADLFHVCNILARVQIGNS